MFLMHDYIRPTCPGAVRETDKHKCERISASIEACGLFEAS